MTLSSLSFDPQTQCFHCGQPLPPQRDYPIVFQDQQYDCCCTGCHAIAQAVLASGLTEYYLHRTAFPQKGETALPDEIKQLALYDNDNIQHGFVTAVGEHVREAMLILEGINCAACIWLNEKHLHQLDGILDVQVNYATHRARIKWDARVLKLSQILSEIQRLGYKAHPYNAQGYADRRKKQRSKEIKRIAIAGLSAAQVMMFAVALYAGAHYGMEESTLLLFRYFSLVLTVPVMVYAAIPFYKGAWSALRTRRLNMDVPVVLGVISAFIGSLWVTFKNDMALPVYYDSVTMFILFLLSTRFLERGAQERSVEAAENLLKLAPAMANRVLENGTIQPIAVADLEKDHLILVKAGEVIAADSRIEQGESQVDEALLTGESRPVPKRKGDSVITGSLNLESPLWLRVEATGEQTVLAGIVRLLDKAQAEKPKLAQIADRIAGHFTLILLCITLGAGIAWWFINPHRVFDIVLAILVVTCPCALSLAAPAAFAAAMSRLLQEGILITRGHALETLATIQHFLFDKTGTLTHGKPEITAIRCFDPAYSEQTCLQLAASLERASEHPLAQCFLKRVPADQLYPVEDLQNYPGKGLVGTIQHVQYQLGQFVPSDDPVLAHQQDFDPESTHVWLRTDKTTLAVFALTDTIREEAATLIQRLHQNGYHTSMLSGDHQRAAERVGQALSIQAIHAGLKPDDKLAHLKALQATGQVVAMVGDGINDAPVLAGANVSIAMGQGTQVARASSDIILLKEHLTDIVQAVQISQETMRIVKQNFIWSLVYNAVAIPIAVLGYLPPWLASLGMSFSSLIVVLNAMRLKQKESNSPE